jgi:hypothetical protein
MGKKGKISGILTIGSYKISFAKKHSPNNNQCSRSVTFWYHRSTPD